MGQDHKAQNQDIADNIREYGWHCLHVFPTEDAQEMFSYSIGFEESYGGPEILIFGLEREKAHALLNECAFVLKSGHKFVAEVNDENILSGGYSVVFKKLKEEHFDNYVGTALRYYQNKRFEAFVMFLPDSKHRFPWMRGYDDISAEESMSIV